MLYDGTISSPAHIVYIIELSPQIFKRGGSNCSRSSSYLPSRFRHDGGEWWNVNCFLMYSQKKEPNNVMSEEHGRQVIGPPVPTHFHEVSF
jgi:hypothetical protein